MRQILEDWKKSYHAKIQCRKIQKHSLRSPMGPGWIADAKKCVAKNPMELPLLKGMQYEIFKYGTGLFLWTDSLLPLYPINNFRFLPCRAVNLIHFLGYDTPKVITVPTTFRVLYLGKRKIMIFHITGYPESVCFPGIIS